MLAAIRPDEWNFPLLLHVLGAMLLVGAMTVAVTALLLGWRRDAGPYTRLAFFTLLLLALPSYVLMRVGAQWVESKEFGEAAESPGWVGVGYVTADLGALLLLVTLIVTGIGTRRLGRSGAPRSGLTRAAAVLSTILLAAWVVAVWAMTAKPGA